MYHGATNNIALAVPFVDLRMKIAATGIFLSTFSRAEILYAQSSIKKFRPSFRAIIVDTLKVLSEQSFGVKSQIGVGQCG